MSIKLSVYERKMDETKGGGRYSGKSKAWKGEANILRAMDDWTDFEHPWHTWNNASIPVIRIVNTLYAYPRWSARFPTHLTVCVSQFRSNIRDQLCSFHLGWLSSFFRQTICLMSMKIWVRDLDEFVGVVNFLRKKINVD